MNAPGFIEEGLVSIQSDIQQKIRAIDLERGTNVVERRADHMFQIEGGGDFTAESNECPAIIVTVAIVKAIDPRPYPVAQRLKEQGSQQSRKRSNRCDIRL